MNKFLKPYNLSRMNREEEKKKMNRLITSNETESVSKKLPANKGPVPDGLTGKFNQTFREELLSIFLKIF